MSYAFSIRRFFVANLLFAAAFPGISSAAEFPPVSELKPQAGLPDPLVMLSGQKVRSKEQWENERRPELKALFQHYMYGYLPPKPEEVKYEVRVLDEKFLEGKATLSEATITFVKPALKHKLRVLLVEPKSKTPAPVFIGMNFCGNHAVVDHPQVHVPESWVYKFCAGVENDHATEKGRGGQKDAWNVDLIVDRGYALASFYSGDLDPDTKEFTDGIEPAFWKSKTAEPGPDDTAAIAAWAWGYHRVVDFLIAERAQTIDKSRIAAVGHSRNGKTTLLAAAMDERIALAIPHQAGCGGTGPSRTSDTRAESVKRINAAFPHWFCGEFKKFGDDTSLLPFDQNCLVALCAPRPVLFTNAEEDLWANPDGQFEVLKAASSVYEFLGVEGLSAKARPELNQLLDSRLGYFIRPGKHQMTRDDWKVFLDFADRQWKGR
ncbi:MAG: acetylxylan esterase [Pirellulaceae bacterium]